MTTQKVPVIPEITNDVPLSTRRSLQAMKVTIEYLLTQVGATTSRFGGTIVSAGTGTASQHNATGGLQGGSTGSYFHLTETQHTDLTDAGDSALHYHASDRALANATGTLPWAQVDKTGASLNDFGTLDHEDFDLFQGGTTGEHYHMTLGQWSAHISGGDNTFHYHASDRARSNHTGTQTASTISDFNTAVEANTNVMLVDGSRYFTAPVGFGAAPGGFYDVEITAASANAVLITSTAADGLVRIDTPSGIVRLGNRTGDLTLENDAGTTTMSGTTGALTVASDLIVPGSTTLGDATTDTTKVAGNLVMPNTSGYGIQIDTATPAFGWRDLLGSITVKGTGGGGAGANPDYVVYRGGIYAYRFGTTAPNNHLHEAFIEYHVPHDWVPGSDAYIHVHWSQITVDTGGTAGAPGNAKWYLEISYADGHGTAGGAADPFIAPITVSVVQQGSTTQYGHMIAEVQFTNNGGTGGLLDSNTIQVDGLFLVRVYRDPGDVADTLNQDTFVHFVDIHYQSTNLATRNKAPNFYA